MSTTSDRFQPRLDLLQKTAVAGFSYHTPQHKRLAAARSLSSGTPGYNSLPRPARSNSKDGPCNLSQARRKMVNNALQDYLKSLNAMTRSIVLETESVEKEHHCDWKEMDAAKKEDIVNDHFVPTGVRVHYEAERASSCCSFSSARSLGQFSSQEDILMPRRSSLHSPQNSSDWDEPKRISSSNLLSSSNDWSPAAVANGSSLSQTSPDIYPSNFDRLHKTQLSFRPNHKHTIKSRSSTPQNRSLPSHPLGSDGESQRTSDDDYDSNPLGFQRSKLRSFSVRSRKSAGNAKSSSNLRSSVRTNHKIRTSPDGEESKKPSGFDQSCRPSHFHTYSTTSTDTDFDEEIDMPDDGLLFDHVPCRKISTDETDSDTGFQQSSVDQLRTRRSFRNTPKICLDESATPEVSDSPHESEAIPKPDSSFSSELRVPSSNFFRSNSQESLDMDSVSMAPSELSKLDSVSIAPSELSKFDEESFMDPSRQTPESMLSVSSYSSRSKSQAVMRNRRGKRGGSHFRVATSQFADRHTQFKNNMLQRHQMDGSSCQSSANTTRANSPAFSVASSILTPIPHEGASGILQAPPNLTFSPNHSKHSSVAESTTSDLPRSPSVLSSPPTTPLAPSSFTPYNQILRKSLSPKFQEHRESGYISSSSESFPVAGRR